MIHGRHIGGQSPAGDNELPRDPQLIELQWDESVIEEFKAPCRHVCPWRTDGGNG